MPRVDVTERPLMALDFALIISLFALGMAFWVYNLTRKHISPQSVDQLNLIIHLLLAVHGFGLYLSISTESGLLITSIRAATFIVDLYSLRRFYLRRRGLIHVPLEAWK